MRLRACGFAGALTFSLFAGQAGFAERLEIVACEDLSVSRGTGERNPGTQAGLHPKKINGDKYDHLERFAMIRFDSKDFGAGVEAASFLISAKDEDTHDDRFRFRVYAVRDGDEKDEKFTEKDYDPKAEGSVYENNRNMLDARQVIIMGTFRTERGRGVIFNSAALTKLIQNDTNGTVTLIIIRTTEGPENSTFYDRRTETPPRLVISVAKKKEPAEPAEPAEPTEPKEEPAPSE